MIDGSHDYVMPRVAGHDSRLIAGDQLQGPLRVSRPPPLLLPPPPHGPPAPVFQGKPPDAGAVAWRGAPPPKPPRPISIDNCCNAAMRFSGAGWVANRLSQPCPPVSGLMMNRCAVAGLASAVGFSIWCAALEIFASAEASAPGLPRIWAPIRSAAYSRVRLMAICTSMAAIGARITMASVPISPKPLLLRLPPKNMPNCASIDRKSTR